MLKIITSAKYNPLSKDEISAIFMPKITQKPPKSDFSTLQTAISDAVEMLKFMLTNQANQAPQLAKQRPLSANLRLFLRKRKFFRNKGTN